MLSISQQYNQRTFVQSVDNFVRQAYFQVHLLSSKLNDFLDISQCEWGVFEMHMEDFSMHDLLREVYSVFADYA